MKKIVLLLSILFIVEKSKAQISITKNDFAVAGDTFRVSNASGIGINNLDSTGANITWDYSSLAALTQSVDTFVAVSSTPFLYQLYFNNQFLYPNTKASVATKIPVPALPAGAPITLSNAYGFYKVNTAAYAQVGFGATISSLPTSIPYDSLDYVYRFPMNFGNQDSCKYKFQLSLPSIGYLRRRATRLNKVDGWGTLITPFGTFNTLRVKSTTYATDTIYISQLMFGTQIIQQPTVEYKWIGVNSKIPYLTINASDGPLKTVTSVTYRDSLRPVFSVGIVDENKINALSLFPNPAEAKSLLTFEQKRGGNVSIELYDATGKLVQQVYNNYLPSGLNAFPLDLTGNKSGLYFVRIKNDSFSITKKLNRI